MAAMTQAQEEIDEFHEDPIAWFCKHKRAELEEARDRATKDLAELDNSEEE
jgi:hypothetical protein